MKHRAMVCAMSLLLALFGCNSDSPSGPEVPGDEQSSTTQVSSDRSQATLYVSPQGDDLNVGSRSAALRTIAEALGRVRPGETVAILPGTYREQILIEGRGDMSAPITVRGDGGRPTLDGQGTLTYAFQIWESRGFVFENLEIRGYADEGIGFYLSSGLVVGSLDIHDNGSASTNPDFDGEGYGINVIECNDVVIEDNQAYRNGPANRALGALGTGINTFGNRNVRIRRNHSHHNMGGGILVEDSFDVTVEDNLIENNDLDASQFEWWDGGIWLDGGGNVLVRNNRLLNNLGPGIEVSDEDRQSPTGYRLENNVSNGNYFGIYIWNFGVCPFPSETVLEMSGNDFSGNSRRDILCESLPCPGGCNE